MFQNTGSASQKENEAESNAGILTTDEIYRKLIAALECKEPHPPAGWCASRLDEEIRRDGREFEPDAKLRQEDALQTCLFYLVDFARRMPEWIDTTADNDRAKLACRELAEEIEKITWRPAEVIERRGKFKVWLKAILAVQTCLIYREETARNINQQDEAKRAAKFSPVKNNLLFDAAVKEEEWFSAVAKNVFENVYGKSSVKLSEKSPKAQPSLF
ncbi:MAG: hypothetical protein M3367_09100 [Acidobacteriota bacterium]|nr:hypothetical protein [Acidobacteriota bacterium]